MDNKTKLTLEHMGPDTQHLVIYNDTSLIAGDLRQITDKISIAAKLKELTISGCNLYDEDMRQLADAISKHPSLTRVNLSRSRFEDIRYAIPLVKKTTIHSLDLSEGSTKWSQYSFEAFLSAAINADTIAELKISINPHKSAAWSIDVFRRYFNDKWRNLHSFSISDSSLNQACQDVIDDLCLTNINISQALLKKIRSGKINSVSEIEQLNKRLSSVIYLAEIQSKRAQTIADIVSINEVALRDHGMAINIDLYVTDNDTLDIVPAVIIREPSPDLPTIQSVSQGLPVLSAESIRTQIEEGRSNPLRLMELGQDIVGVVGNIALASLHATTSTPSMETPVRSMADFLEKFAEAKRIIEEHVNRAPTTTVLPMQPWKKLWISTYERFFGQAQELHSLADAGTLANEAGRILQDMIPSLLGMEGHLAEQLAATHQVIGAYQHVSDQIKLIREVGHEVLGSWSQAANPQPGPEEPFHVQSLIGRLEFLEQIESQVNGHVGRHMLHGAIEQKQQQGVSSLRGQNIPLIAEQVATFMRQVMELQRAEVINSLANATREATDGEEDMYTLAARETIAAIENLAGSTQEALANMGKAADQITAHIGPVQASGAALPSPQQGVHPV